MQVWLVDVGHMVVLENTNSYIVPILFSPVHPYIFFKIFLNMLIHIAVVAQELKHSLKYTIGTTGCCSYS